ncbi:uncharacterized protein BDR25DRAFT_304149 [Lindgomyces ingoldianus]|uniref:Uncharacterized protein n=1 Tax=Lindgomyces ingoldianus TaxID=673940 RepID=A0ACB6QT80_9PLEO|nr:uncharacterized protein BDR25DRAFT_304149 [Lindgomyces ingoldianus]KAF2470214.1 hypothetical protein BDR25DRAFT_304149 [Lindgomyces ingoldianus]
MKVTYFVVSCFAALTAAANHYLPRAIGDYCSAPEGVGTCQKTSNCNGIAYPNGYCPHDPVDVQCCVPIKCSAPYTSSLCRHTAQGCSGGSFISNHCPGDSTIKCCVKSESSNKPSCSNPAENTCTFYPDCLETKVKCGAAGYPLGYGLKYCKLFTAAAPGFSSAGKAWITKTMLCLQRNLVPYATGEQAASCPALKEFAFATHPGCYVSSGVCALPPTDWDNIISTVSLKELFGSVDALKATLQTAGDCVEFYEWLIKKGVIKVIDKVEDTAKSIWKKITDWF